MCVREVITVTRYTMVQATCRLVGALFAIAGLYPTPIPRALSNLYLWWVILLRCLLGIFAMMWFEVAQRSGRKERSGKSVQVAQC